MAEYELPNHVKKRPRYFDGQFLVDQDFVDEQNYHLDRQRRQNRLLRTPGILEGLEVEVNIDRTGIRLAPGTAVDFKGRLIIVSNSLVFQDERQPPGSDGKFEINLGSYESITTLTLHLGYREIDAERNFPHEENDQAREVKSPPRWEEQAVLEVTDQVPNSKDAIQLGTININSDGSLKNFVRRDFETYSAIEFGADNLKIRRRHGSRLEVTGSLSIQQHLSVSQNLKVSGDVSIGNVSSREKLSVDGGIISRGRGLTFLSSNDEVGWNTNSEQIATQKRRQGNQIRNNFQVIKENVESIVALLSQAPNFTENLEPGRSSGEDALYWMTIGGSDYQYNEFHKVPNIRFFLEEVGFLVISDEILEKATDFSKFRSTISSIRTTAIPDLKQISEMLNLALELERNVSESDEGLGQDVFITNIDFLTTENVTSFQEEVRNLEFLLENTDESLDAYQAISQDIEAYGIGARETDSLIYDTHKYHRWRVNKSEKMVLNSAGQLGIGLDNPQVALDVNGSISSPCLHSFFVTPEDNWSHKSEGDWETVVERSLSLKTTCNITVIANGHGTTPAGDSSLPGYELFCAIFIDGVQQNQSGYYSYGMGFFRYDDASKYRNRWQSVQTFTCKTLNAGEHTISFKLKSTSGTSAQINGPAMLIMLMGSPSQLIEPNA